MRHLLLSALCVLTFTAQAQRYNNFSTNAKYEVSILTGRASDLVNDFVLAGDEILGGPIYFNSIRGYRNFDRWQLGVGVDLELKTEAQVNTYRLTYKTPHVVFNRIQEGRIFSYYAGVMLGYTIFHYHLDIDEGFYNSTYNTKSNGTGIVGGVQGGVNVKIYKSLHFNVELAGIVRNMKGRENSKEYRAVLINMPKQLYREYDRDISVEEYLMPFRAGLRFRF